MIVGIIGSPVSGKTTLLKSILKSLGEFTYITINKDFKCTRFKDILCLGQFEKGTFSGTDSWRYSTIGTNVFENFIKEQTKNYQHILFEGERLTPKVKFLIQNYDTKIFALRTNEVVEKFRHEDRGIKQNPKWILGRKTMAENLIKDDLLNQHIFVRENNTHHDAKTIKDEILEIVLK